jgi:hypothetical protein
MTTTKSTVTLPIPLLLGNAVGMLMIAAGIGGLTVPEAMPALARPAVAYALIAAGLTLDLTTAISIIRRVGAQRR